jgi:hypothetical protein
VEHPSAALMRKVDELLSGAAEAWVVGAAAAVILVIAFEIAVDVACRLPARAAPVAGAVGGPLVTIAVARGLAAGGPRRDGAAIGF